MTDINTQAASNFYNEVRLFSEKTKDWESAIFYETKPDEVLDLTLVSQRVYGRRDEYLAIMAAAGIDSIDQKLTPKRLVLPTDNQLYVIKRKTGFESRSEFRRNGKPTWIRD